MGGEASFAVCPLLEPFTLQAHEQPVVHSCCSSGRAREVNFLIA